jgi:D-glutamate cyclase-like protein
MKAQINVQAKKPILDELALSKDIESLLVARNLRGMKQIQPALTAGYCLRAAKMFKNTSGCVLIGTGFPVDNTFETDGPVGALILYQALEILGLTPVLVCCATMAQAFNNDHRVHIIKTANNAVEQKEELKTSLAALEHFKPQVIISIERPGLSADGRYYNMRGEDISARAACFDYFLNHACCPTIAIGDGGNEIGMGKVNHALAKFNIIPALTSCDELIVTDVSNWGVYGILAFLSLWSGHDLLAETCPVDILKYLSKQGSVDGVTRKNELTEDSLPASEGITLIKQIRTLIGFENK